MHLREDRGILDPNADEIGNLEKASIGQRFTGEAPIGELPNLLLVQAMKAFPISPYRFGQLLGVTRLPCHSFQGSGCQGQRKLVIAKAHLAVFKCELELVLLERLSIGFSKKRQKQATGSPVNVEVVGVAAVLAELKHVPPPGVGGGNRHVVGHDVQHQPQTMLLQCLRQAAEARGSSQLRLQFLMVRHVVTVRGAWSRPEDGRGVEMTDTQISQIGNQLRSAFEGHPVAKLQAIGGAQVVHSTRGLSAATAATTVRKCGWSSKSSSATGRRRRQLGWPAMVPGKFGCSSSPRRSSNCTAISRQGVVATSAWIAAATSGP